MRLSVSCIHKIRFSQDVATMMFGTNGKQETNYDDLKIARRENTLQNTHACLAFRSVFRGNLLR